LVYIDSKDLGGEKRGRTGTPGKAKGGGGPQGNLKKNSNPIWAMTGVEKWDA